MGELDGRTAVVTGASRGLGRSIAVGLAAAGANVVVNYARSDDAARSTVDRITAIGGAAVRSRADVTTAEGAALVIAAARQAFGRVDVLVNNAVGPHPMMSVGDTRWEDHLDQLRFAVAAPVHLVRAALDDLVAGGGCIVNIGSEVAARPPVGMAAYTTAKSALLGLTRAWAVELGPRGVRANLVAPGFTPVERHADVTDAARAAYTEQVPLRRTGQPTDVADAVVFLASERATFVTGQVVAVNGGRTL